MRCLDMIVVTPAAMLGETASPDATIAIEFAGEARNYLWFCNVRFEGTADVWA
jgi:hypothetical protein